MSATAFPAPAVRRFPVRALGVVLLVGCAGAGGSRIAEEVPVEPLQGVDGGEPADAAADGETPERGGCTADSDCVLSPWTRAVSDPGECYCPACPTPETEARSRAHRESWERFCADSEREGRCPPPVCPRLPGDLVCHEGRCSVTPASAGAATVPFRTRAHTSRAPHRAAGRATRSVPVPPSASRPGDPGSFRPLRPPAPPGVPRR